MGRGCVRGVLRGRMEASCCDKEVPDQQARREEEGEA
jgi:hypothetical protein